MKKNNFATVLFFLASFKAYAGVGPVSVGDIYIGMSKSKYISVLKIKPVDCSKYKYDDGTSMKAEMKYLNPQSKTLCDPMDVGTIETNKVNGLSYDAIHISQDSGESMSAIGSSSDAFFINDRLVGLNIMLPKVDAQSLIIKYGEPKIVDQQKTETCKNRIGNEFNNVVGKLDAVWVNGNVEAIYRSEKLPPEKTCTDGLTINYYILQEPESVKLIDDAIIQYQGNITKENSKASPF